MFQADYKTSDTSPMTPENLFYEDQPGVLSKTMMLESEFLRTWRSAQRHFIAKCTLVGSALFSVLSALFYAALVENSQIIAAAELSICGAAVALFMCRKRLSPEALRYLTTALVWTQMAISLWNLGHAETSLEGTVLPLAVSILAVCCFVMLYPAGRFSLTVLVLVNTFIAGSYIYGAGSGAIATVIYAIYSTLMLLFRLYFDNRQLQNGRSEFRFRMMCAPPHLVMKGAKDTFQDSVENFMPEKIFCVCLATDWRQYFQSETKLSPSQLSMSISEFYDLCERILHICLPRGNYFSHWIADELCVTIYQTPETDAKDLARCGVDFGTKLIEARQEFTRLYGLPTELDIGISSGEAVIGMMGPESQKKATALGEVPGRARRIYGSARLMRMTLGRRDRLILDAATAALLPENSGHIKIELTNSQSIRDFPDREVYVMTPEQFGGDVGTKGVA
jgi:class 3 adenylate cyclase